MKFQNVTHLLVCLLATSSAFTPRTPTTHRNLDTTSLGVSIGLGPDQKDESDVGQENELVPGVDYEIPDHDAFRLSRRSRVDEQCDEWFGALLGEEDSSPFLGDIASAARTKLTTPVELKNEIMKEIDHPDYTPYVNEKLPWEPLLPAFGLEEFGLPVPRRNAEAWRHFDVTGMVNKDYTGIPDDSGHDIELSEEEALAYKAQLIEKGGWLEDDEVTARLVYVNGRFCPQLSLTSSTARNMEKSDLEEDDVKEYLSRLTDGFTDELAAPVPSGPEDFLTSYSKLSFPHHCLGDATSQFAINTQQGTACFAALNTVKTGAVAFVRIPEGTDKDTEGDLKPVLLVNAISKDMGCSSLETGQGASCHPRALVIAEEDSRLSLVQSCVDLDVGNDQPKLYNGYTQVFAKKGAEVRHAYLEESGGMVTGGTELSDDEVPEGSEPPRTIEADRAALKDTHLEAMDVHLVGDEASYASTVLSVGGSGRVRLGISVSLLRPGCSTEVKGFSLSGGAQRTDVKTNIHHVAQGCTSEQVQKNMIGGRAVGSFRGRIRVEQSGQQTDSDQLSRTILLSDRARAWAAPTLEIIADDVKCAHGATISDLSEEELFYLRSRGLDRATARNMLMYAFAGDISVCVDPAMRGEIDSKSGVTHRVLQRLENLVPRGERKVRGEFQSV